MPLLSLIRFFFTLASLAILGAAGYLLWSWGQGEWLIDRAGMAHRVREDWRLWAGLGLAAWSFLGRFILLPLLARPDTRRVAHGRSSGIIAPGADGSHLYRETHGPADAPTIIFTHGWGLDSTVWRYARQDLAARFQLVLWDLPGLGRSKAPADGKVSLERFAADLGALMSSCGPRPVVLVGHSIGGMTIQTLVRDHPELQARIAGVVLVNTTFTNPLRTMIASGLFQALRRPMLEPAMWLMTWLQPLVWLANWQSYLSGSAHLAHRLGFGKFVTRSQLNQSALLVTRNSPSIQAKGNLAMFRWDATGALAAFHKPVLVLAGDMDIITRPEASGRISAEAPMGRLQVIEGANHMGFMERAEIYDRLIGEFALSVQTEAVASERSFASVEPNPEGPSSDRDHDRSGLPGTSLH